MSYGSTKLGFLRGAFSTTIPGIVIALGSVVDAYPLAVMGAGMAGAVAGGALGGNAIAGKNGAIFGGVIGAVAGGLATVFGDASTAVSTFAGTVFGTSAAGTFLYNPKDDPNSIHYRNEEWAHFRCYMGIWAGAAAGAPTLAHTLVRAF
jgi:hypothetical protein